MEHSLSGLKVIIIEDETMVAHGLEGICQRALASEVLVTDSLIDANQILRTRHFDVALVDIRLRDGEAWLLTQELADLGIPMVIHSGYLDESDYPDKPQAIYLMKPANPEEINAALLDAYASRTPKGFGAGESEITLH